MTSAIPLIHGIICDTVTCEHGGGKLYCTDSPEGTTTLPQGEDGTGRRASYWGEQGATGAAHTGDALYRNGTTARESSQGTKYDIYFILPLFA